MVGISELFKIIRLLLKIQILSLKIAEELNLKMTFWPYKIRYLLHLNQQKRPKFHFFRNK